VITGQLPGERFGSLVTGVGDVDGDGDGDIAIVSLARGIPQDMPGRDPSPTSQRILIHSNTHWHPKWEPLAGSVVAWIGDINGDGNADILASDPLAGTEGAQEGIVRVYSGADGSVLTEVRGDVPGGQWGHGLASIQDLDGDGSRDIVAGGPRMPEEVRPGDASRQEVGHVRIVGSVTGSQIARIDGGAMGGWFGYEVATGGDFDGDGMEDFVVSESQRFLDEDPEGGEVTVFSGATREPLLRVRSGHGCSWATSVAVLGDATGDGVPDLAVGDTNGFGHGAALFSGRDGQLLTPIQAEEDVFAGVFSVARVGDVNGDGKADVLVGRTVGMTTVANEVFVQRL
jgi:hypothetical protein